MTKLRPLGNQLVIRRAAADDRSKGGLIIPDNAQTKPHRGEVIAAGPGYHTERGVLIETTCAAGDVVLFAANTGVEVTVDGETYTIVSEDAVIAQLEVVS